MKPSDATENECNPAETPGLGILAPAGNKDAFLAAIAAGADCVYCGLKTHSARMEAKNFTLSELTQLTRLAHSKGVGVYVALNSLVKTDELNHLYGIISRLTQEVKPDALIIADLSIIRLARNAGFCGEIHLSTLANVSMARALHMISNCLGVDRVVIPRELNVDEIKSMAAACPQQVKLEVFVHGALCYGVSGRCYWSSYLGGKSGLRGRCVQPCRRGYDQGRGRQKFFSCQDLSLDVLVKVLRPIANIAAWKIEGRKKSAHYVYYTVSAYRLLRDHPKDPEAKKSALGLLQRALGRPGTHYFFLPQRPYNPIDASRQTGSGLYIGKVAGAKQKLFFISKEELLPQDVIRVGYEDETWHKIYRINKYIPNRGRFDLKTDDASAGIRGTPVFLTDRREKELQQLISGLDAKLEKMQDIEPAATPVSMKHSKAKPFKKFDDKHPVQQMIVHWTSSRIHDRDLRGLWLSKGNLPALSDKKSANVWWWLPPVIWPDQENDFEALIQTALRHGARQYVLNAPWQRAFFNEISSLELWAGPFCNIANPLAVDLLKTMGFSGVIVSPELSGEDYLRLPADSSLPLGILLSANWPLCVSRATPADLKIEQPFISPKNEQAWAVSRDGCIWIFPNWELDIREYRERLAKAGYRMFIDLVESVPKTIELKKRPGKWNWDLSLQ
jgi:U32 family peptidase